MTYLDTPIDATVSQWPSGNVAYGTLCDFYNAYHDSAETMKGDIESLRNTISSLQRQNSYANNLLANAKVVILEAFDGDEFGKDVVNNIAEALEIQLTKEYQVKINVMFSGTITAPIGLDEDDFGNDIEYSASLNNWRNSDEMELDLYEDVIDFTITN